MRSDVDLLLTRPNKIRSQVIHGQRTVAEYMVDFSQRSNSHPATQTGIFNSASGNSRQEYSVMNKIVDDGSLPGLVGLEKIGEI